MANLSISMLASALRMGTPIALTTMGGLTSERSGVVNIGLKGVVLASAFGAVIRSYPTDNPWIGVLFAILVGVLISAVRSVISIARGGNQSISSMALVLLATGFSGVGLKSIFGQQGSFPQVASLEHTPILSGIPVIGGFLADLSPFVYTAFIVLVLARCLFKYTPLGPRIITVGEDPRMAETAGLSVHKIHCFSVILSGVLGGLGGAFLSLGQMNLFQEGMVTGRGHLTLGVVTMGRWTPIEVLASAMFFGLFSAIQLYMQTIPNNPIPSEFIQMIPYLASLMVLALSLKKNKSGQVDTTVSRKPYTKLVQQR